jgi:hypothetical protein
MNIRTIVLGTIAGAAGLAAMVAPASAFIACNHAGDCWHTDNRDFHHGWGIVVHDDAWRWRGDRYHWREHEGHGYWRNGVWITF